MGQYHKIVNLDRREYINPHRLGCGLKQVEQLGTHPGTGAALLLLLASASTGDGGGDFDQHQDVLGRWRGDRIAMVGDYDDDVIYTLEAPAPREVRYTLKGAEIYSACDPEPENVSEPWTDVSDLVAAALERELGGKFKRETYTIENLDGTKTKHEMVRSFVYGDGDEGRQAIAPDMVLRAR